MYITKKMPAFEGVARGSTATLRMPVGLSYHTLWLEYSGFSISRIDEIRVVANGKIFQRYSSGNILDEQNRFFRRTGAGTATSGIIPIDFIRPNCRTLEGELITLLGTGAPSVDGSVEIANLALEIDLANSTGVANPLITATAVQSDPVNLGLIKHVREFIYNPSAAGDFEIIDLPRGDLYDTVFFRGVNISELTVERDGYLPFQRSAALNKRILDDSRYRDPGLPNYYVFNATENGFGSQTFETGDTFDLRFRLKMSGPAEVKVIVHSIGTLN